MKDNIINFQTKTGIDITMYLTEDNFVRVKYGVIGEKYTEMPFKIHKPVKNAEITDADIFAIGDFIVKKDDTGYWLFNADNEVIYRAEIEIEYDKNGAFVAIESEWDRVGLVQNLKETRTYFNGEAFYGMGEASDSLTLNNRTFKLYHMADLGNQELMYIPFCFTDTGCATYYNSNGNDTIEFADKSEALRKTEYKTAQLYLDYYIYQDSNPKSLISRFYTFSDSKSMLPKWVFGYIQSKFGYENEAEIYQIIEQAEKYNMPLSAIVIDYHWYDKMGDLDWSEKRFPNHKKMYETLKEKNIKLLTITQPYFTKDCKNYEEFDKEGIFAKRIKEIPKPITMVWGDWWCKESLYGAIINPIAESAKKLLGEKYVKLKSKGLDGFWLDLGEPENVPPQAYFNQYPEQDFHLYFANEWIKLIYEAVSECYPNERLFFLSRCGYTGTAKYNVSVWSGDSSSTFKNLEKQISIGVNSGLSGYSYWGSDAGGFLSQLKLPDEELYIRWLQFACFTPVFRTHGKKTPREPWCYGGRTTDIILELINFRYKMLPYIYSASYQTFKYGVPIMRPMFLENPGDKKSWAIQNQFYFGDFLLVAPIYEKIEENEEKQVYLPQGKWYDLFTLKPAQSGDISVKSVIDKIPVFVKEGAIVVFEDEILAVESEKPSHTVWYIDDGESNDYLKGDYEAVNINLASNSLSFTDVKEEKTVNIKYLQSDGTVKYFENIVINKGNTDVALK